MKRIFYVLLLLICAISLNSCKDSDRVTYMNEEVVFDGDIQTHFKKEGESRNYKISVKKLKYINDQPTEEYIDLTAEHMDVEVEGEGFTVERVSESEVKITATENMSNNSRLCTVTIAALSGDIFTRNVVLSQQEAAISYSYRITRSLTYTFPKEGGEKTITIDVEAKKYINDHEYDWVPSYFNGGVKYKWWINTPLEFHNFELSRTDVVGRYEIKAHALPYYFNDPEKELLWFIEFYQERDDIKLNRIDFLQEQDRSLVDDDDSYPADYSQHGGTSGWLM